MLTGELSIITLRMQHLMKRFRLRFLLDRLLCVFMLFGFNGFTYKDSLITRKGFDFALATYLHSLRPPRRLSLSPYKSSEGVGVVYPCTYSLTYRVAG